MTIKCVPVREKYNYVAILPLLTVEYSKPNKYYPYKELFIEFGWLWFYLDIEITIFR